ncbi:MAG: class I SAM-dependent RNA methyltransferase [Spirochaetes bacterium]|nr:class I SAM-dependent RNA methyltransferase [Spirochaetota bacterium]
MPHETESVPITLEKPLYGGYSLGRIDGKAVLVPAGIPGEEVLVRITEHKKDYSIGAIEAIIHGSADRIIPACPLYGQCGGCCYQHLSYDHELRLKETIVLDCLIRISGADADKMPGIRLVHGNRFNYRSHATLKARAGNLGFFRRGSNDLVPLGNTGCLLLGNELNDWLSQHPRHSGPGDFRIASDSTGMVVTSRGPDKTVRETACGISFSRGLGSFFQSNRILRDRMIEIVKEYAGNDIRRSFLDIGCGVGFFSLCLAGQASEGVGIDISKESIRWAKRNAARNGITNIRFQALPSALIHPGRLRPGLVVIDPPRAGIDKKTRRTIIAIGPAALLYVSCNPSTFARDARDFMRAGYRLESLSLIDMFPCTHHIEVISSFIRR